MLTQYRRSMVIATNILNSGEHAIHEIEGSSKKGRLNVTEPSLSNSWFLVRCAWITSAEKCCYSEWQSSVSMISIIAACLRS